ncbi:deoxyribose-phosphate aldolase [Saprospira sp. CCB-QB6]|uniref:deoxyribose-phosphate aldolase n=1 Tax=Saprospira sp. CCB-QB6 TaxID=3023936 RepID=UPI002349C6A2|nr:deoxyribose-phosphate aldolase [Saprospira sp. CCB-QB6]WCL82756.1 deoxyribose-phosphate aldolase [Saprospira sp. CCB-QB6]
MNLADAIEHTLLKANASSSDIEQLCQEAVDNNFVGVCIPPFHVNTAKYFLSNFEQRPKIVTVIGFPMGYSTISAKVEEAKRATAEGADEVDMVVNIAAVMDGEWSYVQNDIDSVTRAVHLHGSTLKVILETSLLDNIQMQRLCDICMEIGVDYVKTSTGFQAGASPEVVRQLKGFLKGSNVKIKASGGIKTPEQALQLMQAGASRLGTSSGLELIQVPKK